MSTLLKCKSCKLKKASIKSINEICKTCKLSAESSESESEESSKNEEVKDREHILFPTLYNIDKKDKVRMWKIWTEDNVVCKSYGEKGGKLITVKRECSGKNKNKKNATTDEEQANFIANREWAKQLDHDYLPDKKDKKGMDLYNSIKKAKKEQGGCNHGVNDERKNNQSDVDNYLVKSSFEEILPMHAQTFSKEKKCLKYFSLVEDPKGIFTSEDGVYLQPKFDGQRCIARTEVSSSHKGIPLTTRNGKQYPWFKNIRDQIQLLLDSSEYVTIPLDGEIYAHDLYDLKTGEVLSRDKRFEIIKGACALKRKQPSEYEDQICFHIYDLAIKDKDQDERFAILKSIFKGIDKKKIPNLKLCKTQLVYTMEEIYDSHDEYVKDGYEGAILRARDLMYENKHRSLKLRKLKNFTDGEFTITDAKSGEGTEAKCVVWICTTKSGDRFDVRPIGSFENRKKQLKNKEKYIGCPLTVKYQELSENGIPRFPVGISIREEFIK